MKLALVKSLLSLLIGVVFAGCMVYPERTEKIKNDLAASKPTTYDAYSTTGDNGLLALQESGRLAQVQGNYRESAALYGQAIAFSDKLEDKALFSVGDAADGMQSVVSGSDLTMDYPALPFERMMLHVLNSFNCLALGDVDGFGVDMRHLERLRELSEQYEEAESEDQEDDVESGYERARQSKSQQAKDLVATSANFKPVVKSSCDNAYALYLMALYREMRGDVKEALSHYETIRGFGISNLVVESSIAACKSQSLVSDEGEVIAFLEEGFVPGKRTNHTVVDCGKYVPNVNMTLPNYGLADCLPYQEGGPLVLFEGKKCLAKSEILCDIVPLAVKAHEERMRGIVARKALTAGVGTSIIKINAFVNGTFHTNPLVEALLLLGGLFTCPAAEIAYLCDERPDLRSWTLLPRRVQVARFALKGGRHEFLLYTGGQKQKLTFDVKPGVKTLIHCVAMPGSIKCFAANLAK